MANQCFEFPNDGALSLTAIAAGISVLVSGIVKQTESRTLVGTRDGFFVAELYRAGMTINVFIASNFMIDVGATVQDWLDHPTERSKAS